jgi:glycosyltransferase involved in cell wall biosynthesis
MIADALDARRCVNIFSCSGCRRVVYLDNLHQGVRSVITYLNPRNVIFYAVAEGPSIIRLDNVFDAIYKDLRAVVSPSKFAAGFIQDALARWGIKNVDVIPHGIVVPPSWSPQDKKWGMYYRAYYMKRKYPGYGIQALVEFMRRHPNYPIDVIVPGAPGDYTYLRGLIPGIKFEDFIPYDTVRKYYDMHRFWLNLADNEGFGMQPLEAMAAGEVVITSLYPAISEYLPLESNFWVRTYDTWDEPWIYLNIRHYVYNSGEFLDTMERAIEAPVDVLQSYAEVNRKRAEEYEYHKVYAKFREYF